MLMVLMYHRVFHSHSDAKSKLPNALGNFEKHLAYLSQNYSLVLPGDPLSKTQLNVCLSFDDAYFDFYHYVYPLLKKLRVPALLAVPSGLILESSTVPVEDRLQVPYKIALESNVQTHGLCTWDEIREMVASKLVMTAVHGFGHCVVQPDNIEKEVLQAKALLEIKTGQPINTFVYPYGTIARAVHKAVRQHYRYSMRIGSAMNFNWDNCHHLIYRMDADKYWPYDKPVGAIKQQIGAWFRLLSNTIRFR